MDRRSFLKWTLAGLSAFGLGRGIGYYLQKETVVTLLDAPEAQREYFKDIARIMQDDGIQLKDKKVLLKPNFVEFHPGRPINTDIYVVQQVAEACLFLGAREVIVGEAAGHRRDPWFSVKNPSLGAVLDKKIKTIDMNHCSVGSRPNRGMYTGLTEFHFPEPLLTADIIISIPKLKTHHWVGVTLSMKNLFGTLPGPIYGWPKNLLHIKGIENSILDLALTVPVTYAIIDGITGMEGDGPILGTAKKVGALIMGKDILAVDCTAARIMGFDPAKINYLSRAAFHLPGMLLSHTRIQGERPQKYATHFDCLPPFQPAQTANAFGSSNETAP
jgi:uncharacterized protein (DUF362 family)